MCTAILNPHNTLPKSVFKNVLDNNPDGIGIGFSKNGKLEIHKDLSNVERIYSIYCKFRETHNTPVMIHARIGTAGSKDTSNIHPYQVSKELLFMHNGIVDIDQINLSKSDTWHVAKAIARFKNPLSVLDESTHEYNLINSVCGSYNKFIFLSVDNEYTIMNESAGHYDEDGNWFSNYNYKPSTYYDVGGKKVSKWSGSYQKGYTNSGYDPYDWAAHEQDYYSDRLMKKSESSEGDKDSYHRATQRLTNELYLSMYGQGYHLTHASLSQAVLDLLDDFSATDLVSLTEELLESKLVPTTDRWFVKSALNDYLVELDKVGEEA